VHHAGKNQILKTNFAIGSKMKRNDTTRSLFMNFVRLLPVIISFILLSAHLLFHTGQYAYAIVPLLFLIPLMFRKTWVPWLVQLALLLGTIEWLRTLITEVMQKISYGDSWVRYAVILAAVALFTLLSCLVFRSEGLRKRYSDGE
jgi:hypothetical protein